MNRKITTVTRPGFRNIGARKHKILTRMDYVFGELHKRGINISFLRKFLGLSGDPTKINTKILIGMNSRLSEFVNTSELPR